MMKMLNKREIQGEIWQSALNVDYLGKLEIFLK